MNIGEEKKKEKKRIKETLNYREQIEDCYRRMG